MSKWLLKTEPGDYSYDDLEREGRAVWDGVKNPVALKHMRAMKPGDQAFFYHTGKEKTIVGIARVETAAYSDPDADDERLVVFELSPVRRLAAPVSLAQVKAAGEFKDWELVRVPRLSVMPVPGQTWTRVLAMSRERKGTAQSD
jgi:predicted RNA-binding protein with PUA-like domain